MRHGLVTRGGRPGSGPFSGREGAVGYRTGSGRAGADRPGGAGTWAGQDAGIFPCWHRCRRGVAGGLGSGSDAGAAVGDPDTVVETPVAGPMSRPGPSRSVAPRSTTSASRRCGTASGTSTPSAGSAPTAAGPRRATSSSRWWRRPERRRRRGRVRGRVPNPGATRSRRRRSTPPGTGTLPRRGSGSRSVSPRPANRATSRSSSVARCGSRPSSAGSSLAQWISRPWPTRSPCGVGPRPRRSW